MTASGGWLTIYYRAVRIDLINGATVLVKDYGPLYFVYGVYLFLYFAGMIGVIWYTMKRKTDVSSKIAAFLSMIVLCSILTWLLEQLINIEFEFLAVFYLFAELLMLLLYMILEDVSAAAVQKQAAVESVSEDREEIEVQTEDTVGNESLSDQIQIRTAGADLIGIEKLSVREMEVLLLIMDNKKRKDIAEELAITENTVKKHTSHIFAKLGVSSRKELFAKCSHVPEHKVIN